MKDEIGNKMPKVKPRGIARKLINKIKGQDPDRPKTKHERFLAFLKNRYGYTNEKAVTEMERLLTQFYRSNKSLGIRHPWPNFVYPKAD
jgi:hypothetical protein